MCFKGVSHEWLPSRRRKRLQNWQKNTILQRLFRNEARWRVSRGLDLRLIQAVPRVPSLWICQRDVWERSHVQFHVEFSLLYRQKARTNTHSQVERRNVNANIDQGALCEFSGMADTIECFDSLTVTDVTEWLRERGFCTEIHEAFSGKQCAYSRDSYWLARTAICLLLLRYGIMFFPRPWDGWRGHLRGHRHQLWADCLKEVMPKYGQRIKVYRAIKCALGEYFRQKVS